MKRNLISSAFVLTGGGKCMKPHPDQSQMRHHGRTHAAFVPLGLDPAKSSETVSLQVSREEMLANKTMKQKVYSQIILMFCCSQ